MFAHPSTKALPDDAKYQRFLIPSILAFCLLDVLLYGIFSFFYLDSDTLSVFSFGLALIFILLLSLSRQFYDTRPLVRSYIALISFYFVLCVLSFERVNLLILLSRYMVYAMVGLLLSGRRFLQALLGIGIVLVACFLVNRGGPFLLPYGARDKTFMEALLASIALSSCLVFSLMWLYNQSCDFSLAFMEKQKQWHDSNRLTKEFVNLAGDMNSVMKGPLEDVFGAIKAIRDPHSLSDGSESLATIKRASDAVYGIARSFGVLAQEQRGAAYNVRINLDELVRYAQIICQNNFKGLGIELQYEGGDAPLEFMGPSGRWLLLLVSLLQFMAEQISRTGGKRLHLKRQRKDGDWELLLTAEGVAPFEFPFDLHQKLKEESTKELLEQTSGKAFLYLLDRWGLKLGSFQAIQP